MILILIAHSVMTLATPYSKGSWLRSPNSMQAGTILSLVGGVVCFFNSG